MKWLGQGDRRPSGRGTYAIDSSWRGILVSGRYGGDKLPSPFSPWASLLVHITACAVVGNRPEGEENGGLDAFDTGRCKSYSACCRRRRSALTASSSRCTSSNLLMFASAIHMLAARGKTASMPLLGVAASPVVGDLSRPHPQPVAPVQPGSFQKLTDSRVSRGRSTAAVAEH